MLHRQLCSTKYDLVLAQEHIPNFVVSFTLKLFSVIYFVQVQTSQILGKYAPTGYICFEWSTSVVNRYSHKGPTEGCI